MIPEIGLQMEVGDDAGQHAAALGFDWTLTA